MPIPLKKARQIAGKTQYQLAAEVGCDVAYISKLEKGKVVQPGFVYAHRIAKALNLEPEELWPIDYVVTPHEEAHSD